MTKLTPEQEAAIARAVLNSKNPVINLDLPAETGGGLSVEQFLLPVRPWRLVLIF